MLAAPTVAPEHPDGFGGRDVSADPRHNLVMVIVDVTLDFASKFTLN